MDSLNERQLKGILWKLGYRLCFVNGPASLWLNKSSQNKTEAIELEARVAVSTEEGRRSERFDVRSFSDGHRGVFLSLSRTPGIHDDMRGDFQVIAVQHGMALISSLYWRDVRL